jgi:hypothetical protein
MLSNTEDDLPLVSELLPRRSFKPAGRVISAQYTTEPKFPTPGTTSKAQRLGKRYEHKVRKAIAKLNPKQTVVSGPWVTFMNASGSLRYCQPDIVMFDEEQKKAIIFEVKYTHTIDAYHQLKNLYLPTLQFIHRDYQFMLVEITRSYDGALKFPEEIEELFFDFNECVAAMMFRETSHIGVLQWKL